MKLKGVYGKDEINLDFHDCVLNIENGVLHRVECESLHSNPMELSFLQPENNSSFELRKLVSEKLLKPESNYKIEYKNENGNLIRIYLKLSIIKVLKLNYQKGNLVFQDKRLKLDAIKYIVGGIFGFFLTSIFQPCNQIANIEPETPPRQEMKKSLEKKKDTIIIINE